jgi:hypothetical protein
VRLCQGLRSITLSRVSVGGTKRRRSGVANSKRMSLI